MRDAVILICLIQHFEADFLWKVSLKILNSGIILKTSTHVRTKKLVHWPICCGLRKNDIGIILFVWFDSLCPSPDGSSIPGLNQYQARINGSCSRTQHSDTVRLEPPTPLSRVKHSLKKKKEYGYSSYPGHWEYTENGDLYIHTVLVKQISKR